MAKKLISALKSLEKDKSINLGNNGYSVKRAKGKGAKGFVVERIEKLAKKKTAAKAKKAAAPKAKKATTGFQNVVVFRTVNDVQSKVSA